LIYWWLPDKHTFEKEERGCVLRGLMGVFLKTSTKKSITCQLQEAINFHASGDDAQASELYKSILKAEPDNFYANLLFAIFLFDNEFFLDAVPYFSDAILADPKCAEAFNYRGVAFKNTGEFCKALDDYKTAIELRPTFHDAHFNLGLFLSYQGLDDEGIGCFRQALDCNPRNSLAHYNIGNLLSKKGQYRASLDEYDLAIAINPSNALFYVNKANALMKIGECSAALSSYSVAVSIDPKIPEALHFIDALACNQSKKPPQGYVEKLFDSYASLFEKSLVIDLGYKIPDIVATLIRKADPVESSISVLDLGCGTGLLGERISDLCERLDGVDISNSMLMEAQKKGAYDDLKHSDIEEYLAKNTIQFDYFVANDVFIYLGDLDNLFGLIKKKNKSGGKLLFTIELNNTNTFQLEQTGRYSHSREYIQMVSDKHGFCVLHSEDLDIRKESNGTILGVLYILTF
jgi:predicted TPR repeat methyltransferase